MTLDVLLKLSGLSLFIGGLLATTSWLLLAVFDPKNARHEHPRWLPLNFLIIVGGVFMALGLPGFYFHQAEQAGVVGLIGFVLLFIGTVIPYIAVHSIQTATFPNIPPLMRRWVSVGAPSLGLGVIITGIATWRAGVYPPTSSIALLFSVLVGLLTIIRTAPARLKMASSSVFTITIAWIGVLLTAQ